MARLHEYQGKEILAANGFKIPRGRGASSADDAVAAAKELGGEVVIKIQAWTTGRAGIGGVAFAKSRMMCRPRGAHTGDESGTVSRRSRSRGREDRDRSGVFSFLRHR